MNWQGLEYSLNAIYYCIWLKNLWMLKTAEKFTKFFLLSLPKPVLPKRYYGKLKKHVTKIRYIMIILCLLILVWAAGKTFETDRGLWMGYKWYPIASSDKVKRKIPL